MNLFSEADGLVPRHGLAILQPDHHRLIEARCRDLVRAALTDSNRDLAASWRAVEAELDEKTIASPLHIHRKHPHGNAGTDHPDDAKKFFHSVVQSLAGSSHILVVGPSTGKLDFMRHLHAHDHAVEKCVVGIETVDHPTDGQLVAYARTYFHLGQADAAGDSIPQPVVSS